LLRLIDQYFPDAEHFDVLALLVILLLVEFVLDYLVEFVVPVLVYLVMHAR